MSEVASAEIDTILELQKTELSRLLAENRRLNGRLDSLVELLLEEQILMKISGPVKKFPRITP